MKPQRPISMVGARDPRSEAQWRALGGRAERQAGRGGGGRDRGAGGGSAGSQWAAGGVGLRSAELVGLYK